MRRPSFCTAFLFLIFSFVAAFAQISDEKFEFRGKFDMDEPSERVLHYELFDNGEKLRLFGERSIQIWDVKNRKVLENVKHGIENLWLASSIVSPDKSKLIVFAYEAPRQKKMPKIEIPAKIYDARTGKLILVLDKTAKPVKSAMWSDNGKTLIMSSDNQFAPSYSYRRASEGTVISGGLGEVELSFWNGDNLEYRASATVNNVTWRYLTPDGEKFLITSGPKRDLLGIDYASEKAATIDIRSTRDGKLERQLLIGDETFFTRTRKLMVNPDGRTLALILKSRKSDADDRMLVWDIYASETTPKYTLRADPKIGDSELGYSPDGKIVALDTGKNAQFYEISTGAKKFEIADFEVPDFWFNDNKVALFQKPEKIRGVEIPSGRQIYEEPVAYRTEEHGTGVYTTDSNNNMVEGKETVVVDSTEIVPHPSNRFFIAQSKQSVKVYDASTGINLRSLVIPPPIIEKKHKILGVFKIKFKEFGENLVTRAEWLNNGKTIAILDFKQKSISLWEIKF